MKTLKFISLGLLLIASMPLLMNSCKDDDNLDNNPSGNNDPVAVSNISLNKTTLTLTTGASETLTATVTPDNATDKTIAWSSNNTNAIVDASGKVTAVTAGTAIITAKAGDKTAICMITISATNNLVFTDNASFDILSPYKGVAVKNVEVSTGVSGGKAPYTYSAAGLPAGLTISSTTGVISGTPTTLSNAGTATITVKDAEQKSKSITINYGAIIEVVKYRVYVGDVQVTSANQSDVLGDGKVTYNNATNTLALNSANISSVYLLDPFQLTYANIYSKDDITINLTGFSSTFLFTSLTCFSIFCEGNITFTGIGNLSVGAETPRSNYGSTAYGIAASGSTGIIFNHCGKITVSTSGRALSANNISETSSSVTITKTCP